jgi:hypothetical protein
MNVRVPHARVVIAFSAALLLAYLAFSVHVVFFTGDAALIGDTIGTWKSFAVAVVAFWIGSSSGGKAKDDVPTGKPEDPVSVTEAPTDPYNWPTFGEKK